MKNLPKLNISFLIENFILSNSKQSTLTNNHTFPIPPSLPSQPSTICHKIPSLNYFSQSFVGKLYNTLHDILRLLVMKLYIIIHTFLCLCIRKLHCTTCVIANVVVELFFANKTKYINFFNGEHLYICKKIKVEEKMQDCFES
jgi:hypothetical protein